MQIKWQRGMFYEFRATAKIHLGAIQEDVYEDDVIEFDGQTMRYAGREFGVPSVRAAIKSGFFVPIDDNVSRYVSKPAGVKVRPATAAGSERGAPMTIETASEEETVVSTLGEHQQRRKQAGMVKPGRHRRESDVHTPPQRHTRPQAAPPPRPAPLDGLTEEEAEAAARADAINRERIAKAMEAEVPPPAEYDDDDDDEVTTAGGYAVVQADDQEAVPVGGYKFSSGAAVGATGDKHLRETTPVHKMRVGARPVASTPKREEPLSSTQVPAEGNIPINETLEGGATGDVSEAISGDDLADLLPDAAKGPEPKLPEKVVAYTVDKSIHWRTRVKQAMDAYGDNPVMIEKIKAMESPGVVKEIEKRMAER